MITATESTQQQFLTLRTQILDNSPNYENELARLNLGQPLLNHDLRWLLALGEGLEQTPYCVYALDHDQVVGVLPLVLVKSIIFGSYLVSLPYVNSAGVQASNSFVAEALLNRAVKLADRLDVKYLELRHEKLIKHEALTKSLTSKVHMRLQLPDSADELWTGIKASVRNQIRKGEKQGFQVRWGGEELLTDFHDVFSHNMRDLGTPCYGKRLFRSILRRFPQEAELCVVQLSSRPMAVALLMHGTYLTEVPSASSLRAFNKTNANMFMYHQLLRRSIERGNRVFDFGRSTVNSNTFRFKKQWGAAPEPAVWQYYIRRGDMGDMRPESKKYQLAIRMWKRLPLWVARTIGPWIARGIP